MTSNKPPKSRKSREVVEDARWMGALGFVLPFIIAAVTCAAFSPALHNQFVDWDDTANLINNPHYRGLGAAQLRWMFTTFHMGPYQPLSWMTYAVDYSLWGLNPFGYHLTNLLLHAANAVLFYMVGRRLLAAALSLANQRSRWRLDSAAAFAALLFAIHPLRVESVAWATERRDVLSGLFYLTTIYCYLRAHAAVSNGTGRWLGAALLAYVLSLLSKATPITLPAVLLLLDVYPLRRVAWRPADTVAWRRVVLEKIPFVAAAALFAVTALHGQQQASGLKSLESYDVLSRVGQVFVGLNFYLWKTLVPSGLSPLYEIPTGFTLWNRWVIGSGVAAAVLGLIFYLLRKIWPAALCCWLYYVVVLSPVLGLVQSGPQLVADRYSYLSTMSWPLLAGGAVFALLQRSPRRAVGLKAAAAATAICASIAFLASLTWQQTQVWRDTSTLWSHVVSIYPRSSIGQYNLARVLAEQGRHDEAVLHYREAIKIRPDDPDAHNNLGLLLAARGEITAALAEFHYALQLNPAYAKGFFNIGRVLVETGELGRAVQNFQRAAELQPDRPEIHLRLGDALARLGDFAAASAHFEKAVMLDGGNADAYVALGRVLLAQGKKAEAEQQYLNARRLLQSEPEGAGSR